MPEGDTLFRTARTLQRALAGRAVTRFESAYPALTRVDEDQHVVGRVIDKVEARGKNLLMHFAGGLILRTHLRMNGSWHVYRPGEAWQRPRRDARIVIETDAFVAVGFTIPVAVFETTHTVERHEALGRLGADLLAAEPDLGDMLRRIRARPQEEIGEVLLNQRVLAGIGNVFKSETLHAASVNPFRAVGSLGDDDLQRIVLTARDLLRANVRSDSPGMIVTTRSLRPAAMVMDPEDALHVYGRRGKPCRRCGAPISWRRQGQYARSTYWCPACQPA
jgi:endonuclease VIII